MKSCLKLGCAFITGAAFVLLILYVVYLKVAPADNESLPVEAQYVEVNGRKGNVTLRIGMPKDSVRMLVGKPSSVDLRSHGFGTFEDWGYKLKNNYISDLEIHFMDGVLTSVRQN
ncbi:MAG: hypothetical protein LBN06_11510 [Prevotellaceae bacterium]|jgi:hypothetical protein|nr:hypothetical protein [Prevotellaceae bacterium]